MADEEFGWSMCDPAECWIELLDYWIHVEFKEWLRISLNPIAA